MLTVRNGKARVTLGDGDVVGMGGTVQRNGRTLGVIAWMPMGEVKIPTGFQTVPIGVKVVQPMDEMPVVVTFDRAETVQMIIDSLMDVKLQMMLKGVGVEHE